MDIHIKESAKRFESHCLWDRETGEGVEDCYYLICPCRTSQFLNYNTDKIKIFNF